MSSLVAFNCFAFVPEENEKAFIDLFAHSKDVTNAFNFGLMTNLTTTRSFNGKVAMEFDCQNEKGVYHGWYKTEHKNIETYCKELGITYLSAYCNRDEKGIDSEVLYYEQEKGLLLYSYNVYHKNIDVQDGIDYYEKRVAKKESELC